MLRSARAALITVLSTLVCACTLPGSFSPTPFSFPTPNLTLTEMFAPETTDTPVAPTLPPLTLPPGEGVPDATPSPVGTGVPGEGTPTEATGATEPVSTSTSSPTAGPTTPASRPNGSPVTATMLDPPPTVDGDLGEWTSNPYSANQVVFGAGAWSGPSDNSATFYVGWDSSSLYLAVKVTDDVFVQTSSDGQMYKGDSLEIQFDADLPGDFASKTMSGDDHQIGFSPGNFGTITPAAYRWYPVNLAGSLSSVTVKAKSTSSGYDLEAQVPWSVLGVTPATANRYGFTLSSSDNDLEGSATQQSLISNIGTRLLNDPTTWGTLILGP